MQEPIDSGRLENCYSWSQRNSLWIGLVLSVLLFIGYAIFTANMSSVFKSMSNSIRQDGTVLVSDGIFLRIWAWSAFVPVLVPTLITLFLYRFKTQQSRYLQLVKRAWIVSFVGMFLISSLALFIFKGGIFIPVESKGLEVAIIFCLIVILALVLSLLLSVLFVKK